MVLETANPRPLTAHEPPPAAAATPPSSDDLIEAVAAFAQQRLGTAALVAAREAFSAVYGPFFSEEPFYDARMSYFLDVLVFEGAPGSAGRAPLAAYRADACPPAWRDAAAALAGYRHSVFRVLRANAKGVVLRDLLAGDKVTVTPRPRECLAGVRRNEVIQGFLYPAARTFHFSPGIFVHPARAGRLIAGWLKRRRKAEGDAFSAAAVLGRLATVQLRQARHRHVDPRVIYRGELLATGR